MESSLFHSSTLSENPDVIQMVKSGEGMKGGG